MEILTRNIKLSESDKEFAEDALSRLTKSVSISFDAKNKLFRASAKLCVNEKSYNSTLITITSRNYFEAINKLKDSLGVSYSKYKTYRADKKRRELKKYREQILADSSIDKEDDEYDDYTKTILSLTDDSLSAECLSD